MKGPSQRQIDIIEFINEIKPVNWHLVTQWDKFEEYEIKKFGFQKRIIVQLFIYKKSKSKWDKPLGEVYGPEKVLDNISLARINLYPHQNDQNWQATVLHCLAHIKAEGELSFRKTVLKIKNINDIGKKEYKRTDHGLLFQFALNELFKEVSSKLKGRVPPELISAVHAELRHFRSLKIIDTEEKKGIPWIIERKKEAIIRYMA
jgi:hypothetical protein